MEFSFWAAFNIIVAATVVMLAFFISYYFLSLKKRFPPELTSSCQRMAQGFILLLGVSIVSIVGGILGALPTGKMDILNVLMLPSLVWALLLLYQAARRLGKTAEEAKPASKASPKPKARRKKRKRK